MKFSPWCVLDLSGCIMSELAYRLSTQQRALARDRLFLDPVMDRKARQRHFDCAQRLAARLIAGEY